VLATGDLLRTNGIEHREVWLTTEDGVKLRAWYTPPKNGAVILVAHGHADKIPEPFYTLFVKHGYGVLAWDFRAHGKSGGDFTSLGYYEVLDVKAALDYARSQPGVEHIGGWGGSMGAATTLRAAARYPQIEAVVADSSFATLEDVIPLRIPYPILRPLIRFFAELETGVSVDEVRPVDDIGRIGPRPVFIIQGMGENAIPTDSAQRLYDAANEPRLLWTENDVPHMNMYAYFKTRYEKRVIKFFDQYLLGE
jgi:fermentation-respiration switch protein FrsA (DUF1100 family)